jgi:hypothetical protein
MTPRFDDSPKNRKLLSADRIESHVDTFASGLGKNTRDLRFSEELRSFAMSGSLRSRAPTDSAIQLQPAR